MSAAAPVGEDLAARLLRWIRAGGLPLAMPDGMAVPCDALALAPLAAPGAGYSNVTLIGEVQGTGPWAAARRGFVLRMQPPGDAIYPDHDVRKQHRVLRALHAAGLPVPAVLGAGDDADVLGGPFFLMARADGRVPNENPQYHVGGWFHDLPAEEQRACWMAGIGAVAQLARLDWRAAGLGFLDPGDGVSPLLRQLDHYDRALEWAERLAGRGYPLLRAAGAWLRANRPPEDGASRGSPAFSWGDAKLGNCVFHEGRLAAILDFEQATLADPVDDLAWWLMLDESLSRGYGAPRLASLPTREETVAEWERVSGREARHLDYYEVFAAWRMGFVMARIAHIFKQRGWIPAGSDMDERNGGATLLAAHGARLGFAQARDRRGGC